MSERSISSDWTPMLLLKAFLQEEPLISRSKSTGSKGELYRPYLERKRGGGGTLVFSGVRRSCSCREMVVSREAQEVLQPARSSSLT
ncbi:hypothetical protein EYF80_048343 [Liparis tanakae]|uniref:Uncharacterized protein n=1 Tax=Liparis tanakae TaxID=230148 RepID=A0A4Z2FKJ0_9TELE|nr:hypothetical protein EYF80_048343 [Liparis tanakae]